VKKGSVAIVEAPVVVYDDSSATAEVQPSGGQGERRLAHVSMARQEVYLGWFWFKGEWSPGTNLTAHRGSRPCVGGPIVAKVP
jgi:hypothetical protein